MSLRARRARQSRLCLRLLRRSAPRKDKLLFAFVLVLGKQLRGLDALMSREILIYGAGGAGRSLAFALSLDKNPETAWKVSGFIDDTENLQGKIINDVPVLGGFDYLQSYSGNIAVTVVNDPLVRRNLVSRIKKIQNIKFPVVISAHSVFSRYMEWGEGCIVSLTGVSISVNIKLGDFVFISGGTRIGHDTIIGDYTTFFSNITISGGASIGSNCVIGSGAIIMPNRKIGDGSIIGAGTLVSKDFPPNVVAAGVPARIIREIK